MTAAPWKHTQERQTPEDEEGDRDGGHDRQQ
jgi:hypothetical protein